MSILKTIVRFIARVASVVYPLSLDESLKRKRDVLYNLWVRNFLGSYGDGTKFLYPCRFWGGGSCNIHIGKETTIQAHCILGCWIKYAGDTYTPSIIIGDNCNIGEHTHISAINKILIGNGLLTGRYVYIGDNSHGGLSQMESTIPPISRKLHSKGEVIIGDNVWIGDKATILAGVRIGNNAIIGANSVVTHDVPSNCIVAGVPAKVVKKLEIE